MLEHKNVLLLVGSPKKAKSSSDSLGSYLLNKLCEKGYSTNKIHILSSQKNSDTTQKLLESVDSSDIIILCFPLYVDSLPSSVIKTFELIAAHREKNTTDKKQSIIAIVNSGFPETLHGKLSLDICKCFANTVGFQWMGGLVFGGGGVIAGQPLEKLGGMVRNVVKSLDITAEAICTDTPIPHEAVNLMENHVIPLWFYVFMATRGWKKHAKKFGSKKQLYARPYSS